jgi:integrase
VEEQLIRPCKPCPIAGPLCSRACVMTVEPHGLTQLLGGDGLRHYCVCSRFVAFQLTVDYMLISPHCRRVPLYAAIQHFSRDRDGVGMQRQGLLTALAVVKLTAVGKHKDGGGLYLQVTAGRAGIAKSWVLRFTSPVTRKERAMGLGSYPEVSLAEARRVREKALALVRGGIDPIEERERQKAGASAVAPSFDDCAKLYIAAHEPSWRNAKHRQQWTNTLREYASPVFGSMPVAAITMERILEALTPLWLKKPETASRVLAWATVHGYRQGEHPARWRGHLDHLLPPPSKVRHVTPHAAMAYAEVPAFMARLRERDGGIAARALAFAILTGCRTNEVLGATWDETDLGSRVWTIPAARMKAGREHRVPLSEAAARLLEDMGRIRVSESVFPSLDKRSRGPLSNMALAMVLRRMGEGNSTVHGFRSAFRDWCGEETSFTRDLRSGTCACEPRQDGSGLPARQRSGKKAQAHGGVDLLLRAWCRSCGAAARVR